MFKRLAEDIGGPIVTVGIDILKGDINHKVDEDNKKEEEKKRKEQEDEKRKAWEKARRERGETTGVYHTPSATRGERFYNERHKDHYIPQSEQTNNMFVIQLLLGGILLVLFLG